MVVEKKVEGTPGKIALCIRGGEEVCGWRAYGDDDDDVLLVYDYLCFFSRPTYT